MRPITTADYEAALEVVETIGGFEAGEVAGDLRRRIEEVKAREAYAFALGQRAYADNVYSPTVAGLWMIAKLLEDGWTAPEGLF